MACSDPTSFGARAAAALAACALLACGSSGAGPSDGGADAGSDAGRDAAPARDASHDAGRDAGALPDAGPPEWRLIPGVPEECPVYVALDPEAVVPPLSFEPCAQYESGCRQVAVDWEVDHGSRFQIFSGFHDGTHGYFSYWRGNTSDQSTFVIARDDGAIVAVVRVPKVRFDDIVCGLSPIMLGGGRFALVALRWETPDLVQDQTFLAGTLAAPADSLAVTAVLDRADVGGNRPLQLLRVTESHLAADLVPGYEVILLDEHGDIVSSTFDLPRSTHLDDAVGDTMFVRHHALPLEVRVGTAGGRTRPFLPFDDTAVVHLSTDGRHMAWLRLIGWDGARAERIELWASPYTEDPSALSPSLLGEVTFSRPHVGAGRVMAGAVRGDGTLEVVVFDAGGSRIGVVELPPDTRLIKPWAAYVGPEEVAIAPKPVMTPGTEALTVQLIRYDALRPE